MNTWKKKLAATALMLGLALALLPRAWPHDAHADHHGGSAAAAPAMSKPVKPSDTVLLDQDGRKLRLASDALADKVVVVSFVYTNCPDICPMTAQTLAQVQERLGPLMEQRVRLVTLTVDPARDTPARLKEYAAHFEPKPGWLWLTGEPSSVAAALQSFGIHVTRPENHPVQMLIGDPRSGRWTRIYSIDKPLQVLAKVDELLAAQRADKAADTGGAAREKCNPQSHHASAEAKPGCVARPG